MIGTVADRQQLGNRKRRDRLIPAEQRSGRSETIHAPWPSAAAYSLNRAMATIRPSTSSDMELFSIRSDMAAGLLSQREVRKSSAKPSANDASRGQMGPDPNRRRQALDLP